MNVMPGGDRFKVEFPDNLKINWWTKEGRLRGISTDLLILSGYVKENGNKEIVILENGQYSKKKVADLTRGEEILIMVPQNRDDMAELRIFLKFYEGKKGHIDSYDRRINQCLDEGKTEKVKRLMMEKELCKAPLPDWDKIFNSLVDRLKLNYTQVGLTELRQATSRRLMSIEEKERGLDND